MWTFPGGKLEQGETIEMGMYREVMEETGFKIDLIHNLFRVYKFNDYQCITGMAVF